MEIHCFNFNVFAENTYVLSTSSGDCAIVDPGCSTEEERLELLDYIASKSLKPVMLLNTHCHIDHIPGNAFLFRQFGLRPLIHEAELPVMRDAPKFGKLFGMPCEESPEPQGFLKEGDLVALGAEELLVMDTPGHSPGSLSFYNELDGWVLSGDVLFKGSIGRYDLPGADKNTLQQSLKRLMLLPDDVKVWSGHGSETTIGRERRKNPFLLSEDLW